MEHKLPSCLKKCELALKSKWMRWILLLQRLLNGAQVSQQTEEVEVSTGRRLQRYQEHIPSALEMP